jgi:hypothetical protein
MRSKKGQELPAALVRARERFAVWRQTRRLGTRVPSALWALAVKVAATHGVSRTASVLGVDYHGLKQRVEQRRSAPPASLSAKKSEFVEVSLPPSTAPSECVIVLEDGTGARMRIHMKGCHAPDLTALGRSFWNAE